MVVLCVSVEIHYKMTPKQVVKLIVLVSTFIIIRYLRYYWIHLWI